MNIFGTRLNLGLWLGLVYYKNFLEKPNSPPLGHRDHSMCFNVCIYCFLALVVLSSSTKKCEVVRKIDHMPLYLDYVVWWITLLLVPFWGANHCVRTSGGALCTDADGPRPGAGQSATWRRARVPYRMVRACAGAAKVIGGAWISLPGGTPSGRRDPRCRLGSAGRPRLL
jgi:hypothetical protein